jgi:hypothetical protein
MGTSLRRMLEQNIADERSRLCAEVLKNKSQDFEAMARRLKACQDLLSQLPVPWIRRVGPPLTIALLTVTLVSALTIREYRTHVLVVANASGVQFAAKRAFELSRLPEAVNTTGTRFLITDVDSVHHSPGLRLPTIGNVVTSLYLCEGQFAINKLKVYPDATVLADETTDKGFLDIELFEKEAPRFFLRGASAQLDLVLWDRVRLTDGSCGSTGEPAVARIKRQLPETLHVETGVGKLNPVQLSLPLDPGRQLVFRQVDVDSLRFVREVSAAPGQHDFVSTIQTANLSLMESGASQVLGVDTFLELKGFAGTIRQIKITDKLEIQVEGTASRVLVGPSGYQRDLTPSYLQYLRNNQQLALLWAAAIFVWGLLWSGKRLLAG